MGHKCFLIWGDWLSCDPRYMGVIGYHVTLSEGHPIYGHNYSYHIRCDRSHLGDYTIIIRHDNVKKFNLLPQCIIRIGFL